MSDVSLQLDDECSNLKMFQLEEVIFENSELEIFTLKT